MKESLYLHFHRVSHSVVKLTNFCDNRFSDVGSTVCSVSVYYIGLEAEGQGQWEKLCCRLISDSIIRLFYFTQRWLVGVMPCPRKAQKELY